MTKLSLLIGASCAALLGWCAGAAAQPARPVAPTTQRATVSAAAFDANDPALDPKLAGAVTAKTVSLKVEDMPALTALAQLAKASGYEIKPPNPGYFGGQRAPGKVTVSLVDQPFWLVLREVCAKGNVNLYGNFGDGSRAVQIVPGNYGGGMMRAAASIKGPFLVVLSNLQRVNVVDMAAPQKVDRRIQVQIQTYIEPKIRATQLSYQPVIDEASDENGNSMVPPPRPGMGRNTQSGRGISWYGSFQLPYPTTNPGQKIAKVKGHIPATLQLSSAPIEIADPEKAAETTQTVGGKKVTFKSLKKQNDQYVAEIVFYRGEQDDPANFQSREVTPVMHLTDGQNREYQYWDSGWSSNPESSTHKYGFSRRWQSDAKSAPVKLVIEVPTGTAEIAIPFELVDLPLP